MSLRDDFLEWREDRQFIIPKLEKLEIREDEDGGKPMIVCLCRESMASRARKAERDEPFIFGVSVFCRKSDEDEGFQPLPTLCEPFHSKEDALDYIEELRKVL